MSSSRILLVEDDPVISRFTCATLQKQGYDVTAVEDGESALEFLNHSQPDLLILDIMLPGISGFEVCCRLREQSSVPVFMVVPLQQKWDTW